MDQDGMGETGGSGEWRDPATPTAALTAALDYLRRGFSIVPLIPRSKQPAVKIAPYLSGAERMSAANARLYWTANPDAGIAIVTGAPSGVVVIDCDPRNGGNNDETLRDCQLRPWPLA